MKAIAFISSLTVFGGLFGGPNYCFPINNPDLCWGSMNILENMMTRFLADLGVGILRGHAIIVWVIDRVGAFIFQKTAIDNGWLLSLKEQMMASLTGMMPGLLRNIAFGSSGLMYVALALSGLMMMLPMIGIGARLVRPERVILWGVLLTALFTSGTAGYDFIGAFEGFRQNIISQVASGTTGSSLPLDKLLLYPMRAGGGDIALGENIGSLPMIFESTYFPAPNLIEVTISEGGVLGLGNAQVERVEDISLRFQKALTGAFYALISLFGAYLLIVVGLTYALLSFVALFLMLFLFAALPLGFFEIGGQLLLGLVQKYFEVFIQALSLAMFLRWLADGLASIANPNSMSASLLWLVIIILMIVLAHIFFNGALRILLSSGQSVVSAAQSFNNVFGGASAGEMAGQAIGGGLARAGSAVSSIAMLAGRPDVALAAGAVSGIGTSMASGGRPQSSYGLPPSSLESGEKDVSDSGPERGDVFVNNGAIGSSPDSSQRPQGRGGATSPAVPPPAVAIGVPIMPRNALPQNALPVASSGNAGQQQPPSSGSPVAPNTAAPSITAAGNALPQNALPVASSGNAGQQQPPSSGSPVVPNTAARGVAVVNVHRKSSLPVASSGNAGQQQPPYSGSPAAPNTATPGGAENAFPTASGGNNAAGQQEQPAQQPVIPQSQIPGSGQPLPSSPPKNPASSDLQKAVKAARTRTK